MLVFADLMKEPQRAVELEGSPVLIAAAAPGEVVVRQTEARPDATMIFQHETISMMQAERTDALEKLKRQLGPKSIVVPIRKRDGSFWDESQVTVGRAKTSDIALSDPAVSNLHAHFELDANEQSVALRDLASSNGTFLNRKQLQPHVSTLLRSGDCVRFGQSVFYFVSNESLAKMLA